MGAAYRGRFAPSPTGPLHAGSLVAALASWLDARAHGGRWLVRIEDVDTAALRARRRRAHPAAARRLRPACPTSRRVWQSQRGALYQAALDQLIAARPGLPLRLLAQGHRRRRWRAPGVPRARHGELVYPGTCRDGLHGKPRARLALRAPSSAPAAPCAGPTGGSARSSRTWRAEVGDFVLQRADGPWAYQLAVVVDDAAQGITDVVRGEDLADNTARQILLQRALGLPTPRYLHTPLVLGANGEKLSKQNGAQPLDTARPLAALACGGAGAGPAGRSAASARPAARAGRHGSAAWRALYNPPP